VIDLGGKSAVVTGGSRGIGRAIVMRLAQQGADVAFSFRGNEAAALETVHAVEELGRRGVATPGDVTKPESAEALIAAAIGAFGKVDILVNNAGITRDQLLMRMKEEDWQVILDTNLSSVYRTSKAVMRGMMKARKGRIISIASVIGLTGNAGQANYAAAKAGIIAFSKSLAREIGSRGITVNVVAPGFIDTDMTRALPEAQREGLLTQIALGRLGAPHDIAKAVAFLASPAAAYITGETLHVNGGMYMP
jgi:3-oxoacyl-[acyl-carrier protein] reductase